MQQRIRRARTVHRHIGDPPLDLGMNPLRLHGAARAHTAGPSGVDVRTTIVPSFSSTPWMTSDNNPENTNART
ncbi:hypothetical protein GCM10025762_12590 [Haloechinothrix salitolerans]